MSDCSARLASTTTIINNYLVLIINDKRRASTKDTDRRQIYRTIRVSQQQLSVSSDITAYVACVHHWKIRGGSSREYDRHFLRSTNGMAATYCCIPGCCYCRYCCCCCYHKCWYEYESSRGKVQALTQKHPELYMRNT